MSVSKAAASLSTIIVVVIVASVAFFVAARPRETLHDALYNCAAALKPGSKPDGNNPMFDKWSGIAISKIKNGDSLKECDPDAKRFLQLPVCSRPLNLAIRLAGSHCPTFVKWKPILEEMIKRDAPMGQTAHWATDYEPLHDLVYYAGRCRKNKAYKAYQKRIDDVFRELSTTMIVSKKSPVVFRADGRKAERAVDLGRQYGLTVRVPYSLSGLMPSKGMLRAAGVAAAIVGGAVIMGQRDQPASQSGNR
ncbi:Uncharacterized protein PBTT_04551 [Plasmodiophora brassicae]|uniref:Uncharacterized protein n=1 Tax=Plasmodiophora brassicae TaxID=37360 RepID=A0A0G4IYM5_PLABS|nr:hypothetical protein PBRA_007938 [Plasmodiophora brassicae]SPQ96472.1 unnamed protein product [Plasmodiophora brassicae]